jgi:hypothetical protein
MDDLITMIRQMDSGATGLDPVTVAKVFALSLLLSLMVAWTYRATHSGVSYSQSYVHTLILLGVGAAFVMLIIGGSIARAFTLVGALSIVRFRHSVRETRDIGFVFVTIVVGMACGTQLYALAVFAALGLCSVALLLGRLDLFAREVRQRVLLVRLGPGQDPASALEEAFQGRVEERRLVSVENPPGGDGAEAVYSVVLRKGADPKALLDAVQSINGRRRASLLLNQQELDL